MTAIVVSLPIWTSPNSPLGRYPNRLLGPLPRQQLALLRGGPSPHPVLLPRREREIPAFVAHLAAGAHPLGPAISATDGPAADTGKNRSGSADRHAARRRHSAWHETAVIVASRSGVGAGGGAIAAVVSTARYYPPAPAHALRTAIV